MTKKLSLILILVLSLSIVSGCGANKEYENGSHTAETSYDDRGWKSTIEVVVEDGKIVDAIYEEINEEGVKKSEDEEYAKIMEETKGTYPKKAYGELKDSLISKQDPNKVDGVTGATSSSEKFIKLSKDALNIK